MRFIAIIPLWLSLMSSCLAAPRDIISFQDTTGQYRFNYNEPMSSRSESRSSDGMTRGSYSYVDANGYLQTLEYEAGQDLGFNVKATNLPQAPLPIQETPEILAARQKHLQLLEEANRQEESDRTLQENNQGLPIAPFTKNGGEVLKNHKNPEALLKFQEQTGIKEGLPKELIQQLENKPAESLRSSAPIPGIQKIPEANERTIPFAEFGNGLVKDFSDNQSRDTNLLLLPKGDANFNPFLKGNSAFLTLPKSDAHLLPLPKGDANFNPFLKGNGDFLTLPKSEASSPPLLKGDANFNPFLKGNGDFSFQLNVDASSLPLPRNDANFNPLVRGNSDFLSLPKIDASLLKGNANSNPFLKAHTDFLSPLKNDRSSLPLPKGDTKLLSLPKDHTNLLSSPKSDANLLPLTKNDANLSVLPKSDAPNHTPAVLAQRISGEAPEQQAAGPLPEPVKDTPEVAAAREAHLKTVAEIAAKSAEPVKDTPEVLAAREAHLRAAAEPEAVVPVDTPKYTPEVQAAREAHFRAYALAAKLAAESDINPKILEQLLGRPGAPKLGPQQIKALESLLLTDRTAEELKGSIYSPAMKIEAPVTKTDTPKENLPSVPQSTDNRGIANLAEKPQLKEALKSPEIRLATGNTPASTSLRIPETKLSSLDEFEQSKLKAAIDLTCGTALKVKDVNEIKSTEDQRLVIIKSGEAAPFISTEPLPINPSERWKNWGFQYMSL